MGTSTAPYNAERAAGLADDGIQLLVDAILPGHPGRPNEVQRFVLGPPRSQQGTGVQGGSRHEQRCVAFVYIHCTVPKDL